MVVAKAPSMPFYGRQFYDDEQVWLSSLAHQGLYLALLWNQWSEGSIPADVRKIALLVGQPEKDVKRLWSEVSKWFAPVPDNPERLCNPQLERVREDMVKLRERRSVAGSKGGSNRQANGQAKGVAHLEANSVPPYGEGDGEATAVREEREERTSVAEQFARVWALYPVKKGKHDAQRHFNAQVTSRAKLAAFESAIRNYVEECRLKGTSEAYMKHGATFFNHDWEDYVDGVWQPPRLDTRPAQQQRSAMPMRAPLAKD